MLVPTNGIPVTSVAGSLIKCLIIQYDGVISVIRNSVLIGAVLISGVGGWWSVVVVVVVWSNLVYEEMVKSNTLH